MLLNNGLKKHSGLSLIELMIAMMINVILLAALTSAIASFMNNYNRTTKADILNSQLQTAVQIMADDIRRAGYWSNATTDLGKAQNTNPFMVTGTTDIRVVGGNCILFTYDYNSNGSLPSTSSTIDDERYGFRLNGANLQTRPPGSSFACDAAATNWENLTNPSIVRITALSFTLNSVSIPIGSITDDVLVRSVDISITGQLVADTSITRTITQHVRIRNDKYVP